MVEAAVVSIESGRIFSEDRYRRERDEIRATYGESSAEAVAKRDQALAALFYRCGWTQEQLAKAEGCSQRIVAYRLLFGRFLTFSTTVLNAEYATSKLSERRFRDYWAQTDKTEVNERKRFAQVARAIEEDMRLGKSNANRPDISQPIRKQFADGKWHKLATVVDEINADERDVEVILKDICKGRRKGLMAESKKVGTSKSYRIRRIGRMVPYDVLMQDLGPILDGLKAEGKKNVATISPGTVAHLVHQLEQLLEKLAK